MDDLIPPEKLVGWLATPPEPADRVGPFDVRVVDGLPPDRIYLVSNGVVLAAVDVGDWVEVPCGCRSNRRTNEAVISPECEARIREVWAHAIAVMREGREP